MGTLVMTFKTVIFFFIKFLKWLSLNDTIRKNNNKYIHKKSKMEKLSFSKFLQISFIRNI